MTFFVATKMESKGYETSHQQPKRINSTKNAQLSSTSTHDLTFPFTTLPLEIITEILLRFLVKSLLQSRSDLKSWLAFISSCEFIKTHLNISVNSKDYAYHKLILRYNEPKYNLMRCPVRSLQTWTDLDYPIKK